MVLNANAEYHGYAARDFYTIAPHFGSLADLQSLVGACHARGMVVVLDVVVNHMGDLIDSGNPNYPNYQYPTPYTLRWRVCRSCPMCAMPPWRRIYTATILWPCGRGG